MTFFCHALLMLVRALCFPLMETALALTVCLHSALVMAPKHFGSFCQQPPPEFMKVEQN